jgi:alkanesulfonate monooxygenase SsuD/methylene tetrahydromethanopterin reductase-like flavin-dependent oxidoreductase (luciferase family)
MRFGIQPYPSDGASLAEAATVSEQLGYETLYAPDHCFFFAVPELPFLDGWAMLGTWVPITSRIRLGVLIANLAWRDPVLLARSVIALDKLSGGRFELGVGAGRFADQAMLGMRQRLPTPPPPRQRHRHSPTPRQQRRHCPETEPHRERAAHRRDRHRRRRTALAA